jgi:hypothetical protein
MGNNKPSHDHLERPLRCADFHFIGDIGNIPNDASSFNADD